jgi:hypothetical protein
MYAMNLFFKTSQKLSKLDHEKPLKCWMSAEGGDELYTECAARRRLYGTESYQSDFSPRRLSQGHFGTVSASAHRHLEKEGMLIRLVLRSELTNYFSSVAWKC